MRFCVLSCCMFACCIAGCASGGYQYGQGWQTGTTDRAKSADSPEHQVVLVESGKPRPIIDGIGWVLGIPGKLLLWDRRVDNHNVSPATEAALVEYLEQNELQDVCVRVNQYAPIEEWHRLRENRHVGAGWRYTAGLLTLAGYTVFPGRLFGGDRYNPYTNSVYVYSDVPALAMVGGGYAKDIHTRELPGTYAVVNEFPVVSMWHETIATNDVLSYLQQRESVEELQAGYKILHPNYGVQAAGAARYVIGVGPFIQIGGAIVGHITGRAEGDRVAKLSATATTEGTQQAGKAKVPSKTLTASKPTKKAEEALEEPAESINIDSIDEETPIVPTAAEDAEAADFE
jgi:hypothetical protein